MTNDDNLNTYYSGAKVIYAKLGAESLEWINKKIPALDNLTPVECLTAPLLLKRLKEGLMRMP